ncbi:MAG: Macrolide-specific efflux protein MacA, partial [Myxococcales bacterium]|nr:Macrolide-specific efflux protein MacA [Myxococcales bacterium]
GASALPSAPGAPGGPARGKRGEMATDRRQVWVLRGERPEPVSIRVGVSDGTVSEMLEGDLKENDEVVTDLVSGTGKPATGAPPAGPRMRGF